MTNQNRPLARALRLVWLSLLTLLSASSALAQTGRLVREVVHGASLERNATGESPDRRVSVYLPPGYDTATTKRYPVVYLLHGIGDADEEFTSPWKGNTAEWGTVQGLMDRGIGEGRFGEMIVVVPDERTKMMGSFYTNSAATGGWEDFTTKDLVGYIDRKYRTLARPEGRGLAGHSMGGYGAIKLGMKHPEVYSVVYAMNPAVLGWAKDLSPENPAFAQLVSLKTPEEAFQGNFYLVGALCIAQAFSPNPARPPFYADLPFKLVDGKIVPDEPAHSEWEENFPLNMAARYKDNLMRLRGFRFDTGWDDEYTHIPPTARALAHKLDELKVPFTFEEYNGDHRNRMWGRNGRLYTEVLPYFWLLLDAK
ncbi:MAG TPA: alpha/beta hydrolase-fold protein [Pyrinomonadaceae bacterium]|jgi:enterochelin esterase-like enzyme